MGYVVLGTRDTKWQPRKDLEGPFYYPNGRVLYYDAKEGKYYDPLCDWYVSDEDMTFLQNQFLDLFKK